MGGSWRRFLSYAEQNSGGAENGDAQGNANPDTPANVISHSHSGTEGDPASLGFFDTQVDRDTVIKFHRNTHHHYAGNSAANDVRHANCDPDSIHRRLPTHAHTSPE